MKVFVINLDGRDDRRRWSLSQASRFAFEFERFPAVSSQDLVFDFVTSDVGACFESHRGVWEAIAKSNDNFGLILEDDFEFKSLDFSYISKVLDEGSVDLLQLGFLKTGFRDRLDLLATNLKHRILHLVRVLASTLRVNRLTKKTLIGELNPTFPNLVPSNFRAGAHAYIISREMANLILILNDPVFLAADDFLMALSRMRTFKIYRLSKSICGQTSLSTSIVDRFKTAG
jgi:GR25 family glycosyltransferase involved in LPS biosynthesis